LFGVLFIEAFIRYFELFFATCKITLKIEEQLKYETTKIENTKKILIIQKEQEWRRLTRITNHELD